MGVRVLEVVCGEAHCNDQDCKCEPIETFSIFDYEDINGLWQQFGPENERFFARGWERTQVEPWHSMAALIFQREDEAKKLAEAV